MAFGIARKAIDSAGGAHLAGGQGFVTVDGQLVVLLGDPVTPHAPAPPHSTSPVMAQGSSFVSINGTPVCRQGHLASCGHPSTGAPWFTLED